MQVDPPQPAGSLAVLRCAGELRGLRLRLDRVERDLETVFAGSGHRLRPAEIGALQEIDIVVQSLDALACFLDRVAGSPQDEVTISRAADAVPLRDLAHRLRGADTGHAAPSGATELF